MRAKILVAVAGIAAVCGAAEMSAPQLYMAGDSIMTTYSSRE